MQQGTYRKQEEERKKKKERKGDKERSGSKKKKGRKKRERKGEGGMYIWWGGVTWMVGKKKERKNKK